MTPDGASWRTAQNNFVQFSRSYFKSIRHDGWLYRHDGLFCSVMTPDGASWRIAQNNFVKFIRNFLGFYRHDAPSGPSWRYHLHSASWRTTFVRHDGQSVTPQIQLLDFPCASWRTKWCVMTHQTWNSFWLVILLIFRPFQKRSIMKNSWLLLDSFDHLMIKY